MLLWLPLLVAAHLAGPTAVAPASAPAAVGVKAVAPGADGPLKLLCASPYGGKGIDSFVGAGVLGDGTIVLAGNQDISDLRKGTGRGFLLYLTPSPAAVKAGKPVDVPGHIRRMKLDPAGAVCVLVDGGTVCQFAPGGGKAVKSCQVNGAEDFGVDAGGELVVLHGKGMTRYDAAWKVEKWSCSWHAFGGNRPGGMAVCPKTGTAVVVGYGMTKTGHEPYKDPYAYGFDRSGKEVWKLWDPDPKREQAGKYGGNGLMADTTGKVAAAGADGAVYLGLFADGGNSVCTRDAADPNKPIAPEVFAGVFQAGPGHGFKGASKTSVAFRVDPASGKLAKGTWMCAWLSPARANGLAMDDLAADEHGRVFVVGNSASNCPKKAAWYDYSAGYQGGGFVAAMDKDFRMIQCGAFQQTTLTCVAAGGGYVVAAGYVKPPDADNAVNVHNPVQNDLAGGATDGYFLVFRQQERSE